jgi:O-methyltransferase
LWKVSFCCIDFRSGIAYFAPNSNVITKIMAKQLSKIFIDWLAKSKLIAVPRKSLFRFMRAGISNQNGVIIFYDDAERSKVLSLIKEIKSETEMILADNEAYQIFMAVKNTLKIKGDIAEVGVYKGGSAKLISEAKGTKTLHLFDTYEGLPELCDNDNPDQFHKGQYLGLLDDVKNYLKTYQNVYFYKGLFPSTAGLVENKAFSFVHLDLDLYESTLDSIKFFYPRMNQGGIMISHDYINASGVRKAFDDFFSDKPEPIIEMSGTQCLIVKI